MISIRRHGPNSDRSRSLWVVALLVLALGLAGVLAYQAWDAARAHRATSEETLRNYASFAASEFGRVTEADLASAVRMAFYACNRGNTTVRLEEPLPPPSILADHRAEMIARGCTCVRIHSLRHHFLLDLRDGSLTSTSRDLPSAVRAWLADTVAARARGLDRLSRQGRLLFSKVGGRSRMVAYTVVRDARGTAIGAYGFEADPVGLRAIFQEVFDRRQLLPSGLIGGTPNDSLLTVTVTHEAVGELYRSGAGYPARFAASEPIGDIGGGLVVQAAIRSESASRLVIGGVPGSRLPLLLGTLALVVGLILTALWQVRREHELARLRTDFVSSVSHELRTPLARIRMFAQSMKFGRVRSEAERGRAVDIIDRASWQLQNLVENVLNFSRTGRGDIDLSPERTNVTALVRETVEAFSPLAGSRRVDFLLETRDEVIAPVDRDALRQIIFNLLDNAVKYGPAKQTVRIGTAGSGDRVRIRVDDEGSGIDPKDRERIFESFLRLESNSGVTGSGIGLALVRQFAERHGGRAWAEAAPGGGARFIVDLPGALPPSKEIGAVVETERTDAA